MTPAERFATMLAADGFHPVCDGRFVSFEYKLTNFVVETDPKDRAYLRLSVGFTYRADIVVLLRCANALNIRCRAVKATVHEDFGNVRFTAEAFYDDPDHAQPFLDRLVNGLRAASDEYFDDVAEALANED